MSFMMIDRLPVPKLSTYVSATVVSLSAATYYSVKYSSNATHDTDISLKSVENTSSTDPIDKYYEQMLNVLAFMLQDPLCFLVLCNGALCSIVMIGAVVQSLVLGNLRPVEHVQFRERLWNWVIYKFIFMFIILKAYTLDKVALWLFWYSTLGFLHLMTSLCKDRFEYMWMSMGTGTRVNWKYIHMSILLSIGFIFSILLLIFAYLVGLTLSKHIFAFMVIECLMLAGSIFHIFLRHYIQLFHRNSMNHTTNPGKLIYYTELSLDLGIRMMEILHYSHAIIWTNSYLTMAGFVIFMHMRQLISDIQKRLQKHKNYLWVYAHLEKNYAMATLQELETNSDNCAICWEKMDSARKLPCGHLFHNGCLQSWMEQEPSCPTCRLSLTLGQDQNIGVSNLANNVNQNTLGIHTHSPHHFFHFDGSRYLSWLPSFSVEVTHSLRPSSQNIQSSQIDTMARQVLQLFPYYTMQMIVEDLLVTRSVDLTIDNILEGRLISPQQFIEEESMIEIPQPISTVKQYINISPGTNFNSNMNEPGIDDLVSLGSQFSKSPDEREHMLRARKQAMILRARQKYMNKEEGCSQRLD
ncbi:E3 ubiquitin-protein ligase AMFR-like isoform X2 [Daktulosphaira vitifoliae]|uniref:E3 ubiquitin-protein ligase AMFR-like isoform X1 n=1 Tax=Daktulosphaira vitifoliae TaxID=58002 RepID=UPI0021AA0F9E|nr:E3 ubiquitin-protein ligase AMFR-like isoform X1 [Daktulosphaira vitifoliae]XP_050537550.1 E3 ubiquitin-protein ligase AMFR-like isoform X2 [Daktulosphaira vitifoliae]